MIRFNSQPALNVAYAGFGQGGCRVVDVIASYKSADGQPYYKTFGLNSTKNDFMELKSIPQNNLVSLDLDGFGKDPSGAIDVLNLHEESQKKISDFVDSIEKSDKNLDLIVFCASMGGGTGTSTIVKTLETYISKYVTPRIEVILSKMLEQKNISMEQFKQFPEKNQLQARIQAAELAYERNLITKVGIIAVLPVRSDGPNTLEQVNKFTDYVWQLAKNPLKGIAFCNFPDNQKFYDEYIKDKDSIKQKNYRDYANNQIAEVFHELNLATNMGGTDVTFDPKDFRKIMLDGEGCLNINRLSANSNQINSSKDMYELLSASFKGSLLHAPIVLQELQGEDGEEKQLFHQKVHHVGLLSVTNDDLKEIGSSYLDEVKETLSHTLYLNGSVFTGHVNVSKTAYQAIAYTFYKTLGLPERLSKGLVDELKEYNARKGSIQFKTDNIEKAQNDSAFDLNLDDFKDLSSSSSLGSMSGFDFLDTQSSPSDKEEKKDKGLGKSNNLDFLKDLKL